MGESSSTVLRRQIARFQRFIGVPWKQRATILCSVGVLSALVCHVCCAVFVVCLLACRLGKSVLLVVLVGVYL